ncbi:pyridoxal-phosphate dependent enzyme family/ornithine cyclodeaminase family protein, partial [Pseudomonas syringae pv. japonica str. M301072]
ESRCGGVRHYCAEPLCTEPVFQPGQLVLNISLRDLGPEVIAQAQQHPRYVEHCLKAQTSPDLAVQHISIARSLPGRWHS